MFIGADRVASREFTLAVNCIPSTRYSGYPQLFALQAKNWGTPYMVEVLGISTASRVINQ